MRAHLHPIKCGSVDCPPSQASSFCYKIRSIFNNAQMKNNNDQDAKLIKVKLKIDNKLIEFSMCLPPALAASHVEVDHQPNTE